MHYGLDQRNTKKNSHPIFHCPTSSGELERVSAAERASEASNSEEQASECAVQANRRASGPILQSGFSVILAHCGVTKTTWQAIQSPNDVRELKVICHASLFSSSVP